MHVCMHAGMYTHIHKEREQEIQRETARSRQLNQRRRRRRRRTHAYQHHFKHTHARTQLNYCTHTPQRPHRGRHFADRRRFSVGRERHGEWPVRAFFRDFFPWVSFCFRKISRVGHESNRRDTWIRALFRGRSWRPWRVTVWQRPMASPSSLQCKRCGPRCWPRT